jgi:MerR family transcriptional regulator, copper efflux regulator
MNIGQLADESGISAKMIRYYESIQLIEIPKRSVAGYRIYNQQDLAILKFIKHAKDLGFSIDHIRNLLKLWNNETR